MTPSSCRQSANKVIMAQNNGGKSATLPALRATFYDDDGNTPANVYGFLDITPKRLLFEQRRYQDLWYHLR